MIKLSSSGPLVLGVRDHNHPRIADICEYWTTTPKTHRISHFNCLNTKNISYYAIMHKVVSIVVQPKILVSTFFLISALGCTAN